MRWDFCARVEYRIVCCVGCCSIRCLALAIEFAQLRLQQVNLLLLAEEGSIQRVNGVFGKIEFELKISE